MIPTMGPNFASVWLYEDLPDTGVKSLQDSLWNGRIDVYQGLSDGVQSIAGFASLHVAITLLMALVAQYTVRHRFIKVTLWVYMGITVLSTTYFGWHYIADDIAGAIIAFIAFYIGGARDGAEVRRARATLAPDHDHERGPGRARGQRPDQRLSSAAEVSDSPGRPSRRRRRSSPRPSRPGPGWRWGCPAALPRG